jgi:polyisoprenoid-binding protein YceI
MSRFFLQNLVFCFCLTLLWHGLWGQTERIVKSAQVLFRIKNAGIGTEGSFSGFKASIRFDPQQLSSSSVEASVESKTLDTGIGLRDSHLRKPEYFGVEKYPLIQMRSTGFTSQGNERFIGNFILTLKGVSKGIEVPFSFSESTGEFKGSFSLNRLAYGIGGNSWTLSDNVTVSLSVKTEKMAK